ncbi:MAG TPA: pyridoxal kinase PdxY [Rhizomicrobium sp.]|nr:pyridoxal kinase PdxY [Rhizomicrobium sp.]
MNVLSIQSDVVYGHVGNAAARFALQRLGHEVWAVPTVLLSSHAGYAEVGGESLSADLLRRVIDGLDANGWLGSCDAILSGYLGQADHASVVANAVRRVKAANRHAVYCLDPVFGDAGRAYAKPGVAEAMARELLPLADIVTPNVFELSSLTSVAIRDANDALVAAQRLGRPIVLVTSVPAGDDRIGTLAVSKDEVWLASTPLLANPPHGSGDLMAALFLAHHLAGFSLKESLAKTAASVFAILEKSVTAGSHEMLLIQLQDALVAPPENAALRIQSIT